MRTNVFLTVSISYLNYNYFDFIIQYSLLTIKNIQQTNDSYFFTKCEQPYENKKNIHKQRIK